MLKEANGAAIILEGGNIYIQPAQDLFLQPMRHIYSLSGGTTSIQSMKELELVGTHISAVGYKGVDLFADRGDMIVRSTNDLILKVDKGTLYNTAENMITMTTSNNIVTSKNILLQADKLIDLKTLDKGANVVIDSAGTNTFTATGNASFVCGGVVAVAGRGRTLVGTREQVLSQVLNSQGDAIYNVYGLATEDNLVAPYITRLEERLEVNILDDIPRLNTQEARDEFVFTFREDDINDFYIPETIAQQEGNKYGRAAMDYTFTPINETTPFPNTEDARYAVNKKAMVNFELDDGKLFSKSNELDITPEIELQLPKAQYKFYKL
jgi:hypothetical protein